MPFIEENEISKNSFGGTELSKRMIGEHIPEELAEDFQIVPSRVRELQEDKIRVYWAHDLPEDPECSKFSDEEFRNKFHKMVFVSNWQMEQFVNKLGIPYTDQLHVIENPITPFNLIEKDKEKVNLIYFSTPHRGLEILVPVFEKLAEHHNNIHLDVFSSFAIYGWKESDKNFEPIFDRIRNHPQMTYHGFVPNEELKSNIEKAHILALPSIWKETSCRVLMESMSAGVFCVHPNLAALPETSGGLTFMYQFSQNPNEHAATLYKYLDKAIPQVHSDDIGEYLRYAKTYADTRYHIKNVANQWKNLLVSLKEQYPTIESRKYPSKMFVYRTDV